MTILILRSVNFWDIMITDLVKTCTFKTRYSQYFLSLVLLGPCLQSLVAVAATGLSLGFRECTHLHRQTITTAKLCNAFVANLKYRCCDIGRPWLMNPQSWLLSGNYGRNGCHNQASATIWHVEVCAAGLNCCSHDPRCPLAACCLTIAEKQMYA